MKIETRAVDPEITRKNLIAGPQLIQLINQINRILDCCRTGIWAKVPGPVLFHLTAEQYPRIILSECHLDVWIGLIILKHGIVLRAVFLDQIVL